MDGDTYAMPAHEWTCFHCGETFRTPGAAADHFGETPEEEPACVMKVRVGGERGLIMELRKAQSLARRLTNQVETLEYQLGATAADWQRVTGLRRAHEAKFEIDFLDGRARTAEAVIDDIAGRWPALVEASRRRVCNRPLPPVD